MADSSEAALARLHAKFKRNPECFACRKEFFPRAWRLRHHCRLCFQSFCEDHSSRFIAISSSAGQAVRVCDGCYRNAAGSGGGGGGGGSGGGGGGGGGGGAVRAHARALRIEVYAHARA